MKKIMLALALVFGVSASPAMASHGSRNVATFAEWKACDNQRSNRDFQACIDEQETKADKNQYRVRRTYRLIKAEIARLKKERRRVCNHRVRNPSPYPGFNYNECISNRFDEKKE